MRYLPKDRILENTVEIYQTNITIIRIMDFGCSTFKFMGRLLARMLNQQRSFVKKFGFRERKYYYVTWYVHYRH